MNGVSFCLLPFKTRKRRRQLSAMASSSCHWKDDDRRPCFTSDTPHFFKIVLAHTLRERKLNVPKKFVRRHGKALMNNQVCLKVAGGAEWKVGLTKSNGNIWFQNGWQDFMEFYSVRLEIQYPLKKIKEYNDVDDGSDHQILDKKWSQRTRDKTQAAPCSLPNKKMKTNQTYTSKTVCNSRKMVEPIRAEGFNFQDNSSSTPQTAKSADLHFVKIESKDFEVGDHGFIALKTTKPKNCWRKQHSSAPIQRTRVKENATTFKSLTVNPSFMVTMRPSYICSKNILSIPRSFGEMHLKESTEIFVGVSDGRVWKIWCCVRWIQNKKMTELRDGWKRFAKDNNLKLGDICVFEMIESIKISFKVTIFRVL